MDRVKRVCGNCGWFVPFDTECGKYKRKVAWSSSPCKIWVHNIGVRHELLYKDNKKEELP